MSVCLCLGNLLSWLLIATLCCRQMVHNYGHPKNLSQSSHRSCGEQLAVQRRTATRQMTSLDIQTLCPEIIKPLNVRNAGTWDIINELAKGKGQLRELFRKVATKRRKEKRKRLVLHKLLSKEGRKHRKQPKTSY